MLFLARKQVDQGSNIARYIDFARGGGEGGSVKWDLEWRRLSGCVDPTTTTREVGGGLMHVPGSLTGDWDGWFSVRYFVSLSFLHDMNLTPID